MTPMLRGSNRLAEVVDVILQAGNLVVFINGSSKPWMPKTRLVFADDYLFNIIRLAFKVPIAVGDFCAVSP